MTVKHRLSLACCLLSFVIAARSEAAGRPNVVWFVIDDMSANFSCYGETTIETPHVDRLAKEGMRFTRAYATSPVCSTFRSAMITGIISVSTVSSLDSSRSAHSSSTLQIMPLWIVTMPIRADRAVSRVPNE